MRRFAPVLAVLALALAALPAAAQSWPSRPVKLMLPLGPGSGAIRPRLFADRLTPAGASRWLWRTGPGATH